MPDKCPESCPVLPRVEALERANEQHTKTHREVFDRLRDVETRSAVHEEKLDTIIEKLDALTRKLDSQKDTAGNCYDWYEIDRHSRTADKTGSVAQEVAKVTANIDYLSMMSGIDLPGAEDEEEGTGNE